VPGREAAAKYKGALREMQQEAIPESECAFYEVACTGATIRLCELVFANRHFGYVPLPEEL